MSAQDELREYLQSMANMFPLTAEAITLRYGREYTAPKKPRPFGIRKMANKMCFMNSFILAESHGWQYVEGFALSVIPVHHAWCVHNGQVIDATLETAGLAYFGIQFDLDFCRRVMLETKTYGIIDRHSETFRANYYTTT